MWGQALWYELCDRNGRLEWGFCKGSQTGTSAVVIIVLAPLLCFSQRQYAAWAGNTLHSSHRWYPHAGDMVCSSCRQYGTLICKLGWASKGLWGIPGTFHEIHLEHYQVCWCCSHRQYATLTQAIHYTHAGDTLRSCRWYATLTQAIRYTHAGNTLHSRRQYATLLILRWKSRGLGAQPPASWSQVLKVGLQTKFANHAVGTDWSLSAQ